jgi:predicted membrane protein
MGRLGNKLLLHGLAIVSTCFILWKLMYGEVMTVALFIGCCFLVGQFTTNMVIIFATALTVSYLFMTGKIIKEGMKGMKGTKGMKREGMENEEDGKEDGKEDSKEDEKEEDKKETIKVNTTSKGADLPATYINKKEKSSDASEQEQFEVGRRKPHSIDYAATIEDAYGELNKLVGSDGIKQLTNDTQRLMKQQLQLAESMQSIAPMMDSLAPLMDKATSFLEMTKGITPTK